LQGLANEVGRLEQKLVLLIQKAATDGPVDMGPIEDLLRRLLGRTDQPFNGGIYALNSPCEKEPDGSLKASVPVAYPPTEGFEEAVFARFNAIAELLQVHKDLKQPNCASRKAAGTPVSVTFEAMG